MKCYICNDELKDIKGLSVHLGKKHKYDNIQLKDYYDKYLKKENEGKCYFCDNNAKFLNLNKGYHRICNSEICVGKTRATGTYEFLMYKYDLSESDAKIEQQKRAIIRGEKIKEKFDELYNNDKDFHKKRSHQTIEFWLNKGGSEEEAKNNVKKVTDMIHEKTWNKRRNNPELYQDVNTTQIKYWLKHGFDEDEAKNKIKERQRTFTLEKCIEKYGETQGKNVWLDRQYKWHTNYKKSNFSKISQELFWYIYNNLNEDMKDNIKFATLKDGKIDNSGSNNELRIKLEYVVLPDFIDIKSKKIIEFNGEYYHNNTIIRARTDKDRTDMLERNGYSVYHISENEYKNDKERIIEQCIDFLNN